MAVTKVGAVIWTSECVDEMLDFYRALGIPLETDTHEEEGGPTHFEADVAGVHFALFPSKAQSATATTGATMVGLEVDNLDEIVRALESRGVRFKTTLQETPWGRRVVVFDPDGRAVEIYQP